jgi:hypothetical protein
MCEYKYLFGSKLLKLENARDEDWLIYADMSARNIRAAKARGETNANHSIPLTKTIISHFTREDQVHVDPFKALHLYQNSSGFFAEDAGYVFKDFNILNHKVVWSLWLKAYINSEQATSLAAGSEILNKQFYHLLYQYYMIKEDTHWISDEAKAKVQKIHDLEMPSSYFEELKALINSL